MGVKVISRQYRNQFYDQSEETDWLLGNSGDWQEVIIRFEASVRFDANDQESVNIDIKNKTFVLNNGRKWSDYGFDIGDLVTLQYTRTQDGAAPNDVSVTFTIINLFGSTLEHDRTFNSSFVETVLPTNRGTTAIINVSFRTEKQPQGLKFRYSHITNEDSDSNNLASFIDGSVGEFSFPGLDLVANGQEREMNPDGIQSGMAIDGATVKPISNSGGVYTYEVTARFMIASFFEQPSDLEDGTIPPILFGTGSLTDNFEIIVFPEWNNPNTVIMNDLNNTQRLGNTGWFNENFNGLDNEFTIESLKYFDEDGAEVDTLDYARPITAEITVSGIQNLSASTELGFGFAWIPQNEDDYFNKETPFHKNLFVNTGRVYDDGVNDSFNLGESVAGITYEGFSTSDARMDVEAADGSMFQVAGTDSVVLKAKFIPTPEFVGFFDARNENDRNYILWISVADHSERINFSDRVSLLAHYAALTKTIPPAGPFPGMTNKFIEHPQDDFVAGAEKYFGFVEDDVLTRIQFQVAQADDLFIQAMTFGYQVVNETTGDAYLLEEIPVVLDQFPKDSSGAQQLAFDGTRGFRLVPGNNKNWVKVERDTGNDSAGMFGYKAFFAAKLRWEYWLSKDDVPEEFFNIALENNGQHNNWLDYLRAEPQGTYRIDFFVQTDAIEDGELKRYTNEYEIDFRGYDENTNIETTHEYFKDSDNTLLNIGADPDTGAPLGVILSDDRTRIEITYTNLTEDFDIQKMYGVITLEIDRGPGLLEHRQLSSQWASESGNPLIPLDGETRLKFEQISPRVVKTSCLVDPALLEQVLRYKITGRIGCWDESPGGQPVAGLYEERYSQTYE